MDRATRNFIERATQQARGLLDDDFSSQLEGTFDILRSGVMLSKGGAHLSPLEHAKRDKLVAAIEHKRAAGMNALKAIEDYVRDAAFTTLNRFVALKMLESRELVQECITRGEESAGYREFCGMAPGVALLPDTAGYRIYIESLFDEFSTEIKVLFDRRDAASVLWPKRQTFEALLTILNSQELSSVWGEDETIGWVYQFFNSGEERKKMRDESQLPRNSRELAVRNQFFTPRYVVQFLTDNTLGRLWLEMHGKESRLAKFCEYFVRSTDEDATARPKKDPRDFRILDPACGSGHFLLYSFDLLLMIYEEAWSAEGSALKSETSGLTLRDEYPDLVDLRRAAPRLIVEQNLYGVDIDPRCAQIAALALWMRAQRAWKDMGVAASARPRIQRTHIVVAEPVVGDTALVEEFAARLNPPLLRDLFKKIVYETRLAGDLGLLLRIEDGVAAELSSAREQFVKQRRSTDFLPGMEPMIRQEVLDLSGINDDSFFHEAEIRIIEALRSFSETAIGAATVRRQLFAGDAAQGIALVDLARTRFDVVLMNPPFGAGSAVAKKEFEKSYPRTKNDVYAAFVERGIQLLHSRGLLGAITSRTGFFLSSFQQWREQVLIKEAPPIVFADLGYGVLDSAMVEVAAYCLEAGSDGNGMNTTFLRTLDTDDKAVALRGVASGRTGAGIAQRFDVPLDTLRSVPGCPFSYWVPQKLRSVFQKSSVFEDNGRIARAGAATIDDVRFVRLWFEVGGGFWVPLAKGGKNAPFYADIHLVVQWSGEGKELKAFAGAYRERKGWGDQWTAVLNGHGLYFQPGLTWPHRSATFSVSPLPAGCIFTKSGKAAFAPRDQLEVLLGILNAASATMLLRVQSDAVRIKFEAGLVGRLPIPNLGPTDSMQLARLSRKAWSLKRALDTHDQTSHAFILPALLHVDGADLDMRADAWKKQAGTITTDLMAIQAEIDDRCFKLYGLEESDLRAITAGFGSVLQDSEVTGEDTDASDEADDEERHQLGTDARNLAAELVSWAVGVAFGRFDVRLATGARVAPNEPDPFDPLPVCSSAMLTGDDSLPVASAPAGYPVVLPENDILVDDPGHARDLATAVRTIFELVFKLSADSWWSKVGALLDPKDHELRVWIRSHFFEHHLMRHSRNRRKAPIIWQIGVRSGTYSVWVYVHRLTPDSLFQIQNDVLTPKLAHEERQLAGLVQSAGVSPTPKERKEIFSRETFVEEVRQLLAEVKRVAPLWIPSLDDGVIIGMCPLWRLVPQHKSWQKELKNTWDELAEGKYDWAHLAMYLWPERVLPKCAHDRSFSIAHGLENIFWVEGDDGKWKPRPIPTRPVEELVRERTSTAVKAALKSLLEAPTSTANGGPRRGLRAGNAVADGGAL